MLHRYLHFSTIILWVSGANTTYLLTDTCDTYPLRDPRVPSVTSLAFWLAAIRSKDKIPKLLSSSPSTEQRQRGSRWKLCIILQSWELWPAAVSSSISSATLCRFPYSKVVKILSTMRLRQVCRNINFAYLPLSLFRHFGIGSWRPISFYDRVKYNREGGMHTLCLLDIKVGK